MPRVILARLAQAVVVVAIVVTATFFLVRLAPGDPFAAMVELPEVPPEVRATLHRDFGLDAPLGEQYVRFLSQAARGDLGWSLSHSRPVRDVLAAALPNTILLAVSSLVVGVVGGVLVGAWMGWRAESALSRWSDRLALLVLSVPEFVLALLLVLGPALAWRLFPVGRMRSDFAPGGLAGALDIAHHLVLPSLAIGVVLAAVLARHQRNAMLQVRDREFIRAARARGVPERRIFVRHALRAALVPAIAISSVVGAGLFGGTVLVENVFAWPGLGTASVDAVNARDYHLVVGCALVSSICVVIATTFADLAALWADPRLRRPR